MKKIATVLSIFLGLFFAQTVSAQVVSEPGTLVKTPTTTAVYYLGDDGKRHAFPNANVYFSWYDDFSGVKTISDFELSQIPLGKNVLYRSGSRLIKTPSVNEVYAVGPWGELRNIATESVAIALYGEDWAKLVDDIDISFFFDYHIVGVIDIEGENLIYPRGSLIHNDGLTWVVDTRSTGQQVVRPISGQAWVENNFDDLITYKYTGFITEQYEVGIPVYAKEVRFTCVYCERGKYDNFTVFESNFINLSTDNYLLKGQLPENWVVNFHAATDSFTLDSTSDPSTTIDITIYDEEDDGFPLILEEYLTILEDSSGFLGGSSLYSGYDLTYTDKVAFIDADENKDVIKSLFVLSQGSGYLVQFYFQNAPYAESSLEKHWDEIELIIENLEVNKLIVEEPLIEEEPEVVE
jgi:hypothetical protein